MHVRLLQRNGDTQQGITSQVYLTETFYTTSPRNEALKHLEEQTEDDIDLNDIIYIRHGVRIVTGFYTKQHKQITEDDFNEAEGDYMTFTEIKWEIEDSDSF